MKMTHSSPCLSIHNANFQVFKLIAKCFNKFTINSSKNLLACGYQPRNNWLYIPHVFHLYKCPPSFPLLN